MFVMIALVLNIVLGVKYSLEANLAGVDTRQGTYAPTLSRPGKRASASSGPQAVLDRLRRCEVVTAVSPSPWMLV